MTSCTASFLYCLSLSSYPIAAGAHDHRLAFDVAKSSRSVFDCVDATLARPDLARTACASVSVPERIPLKGYSSSKNRKLFITRVSATGQVAVGTHMNPQQVCYNIDLVTDLTELSAVLNVGPNNSHQNQEPCEREREGSFESFMNSTNR